MSDVTLFTESQRFRQWWVWSILAVVNGIFVFGIFKQVIGGQQFGSKPMSDTGLLIMSASMMALTVLFINFRLETIIKEDGIYVRFFPFHLKLKYYPWHSLTKCYVRQYSAISEYGGWGLRINLFGKGTAYNVSGNQGIQLEFINNKKLLIGTGKSDELTATLSKIGQLKQ